MNIFSCLGRAFVPMLSKKAKNDRAKPPAAAKPSRATSLRSSSAIPGRPERSRDASHSDSHMDITAMVSADEASVSLSSGGDPSDASMPASDTSVAFASDEEASFATSVDSLTMGASVAASESSHERRGGHSHLEEELYHRSQRQEYYSGAVASVQSYEICSEPSHQEVDSQSEDRSHAQAYDCRGRPHFRQRRISSMTYSESPLRSSRRMSSLLLSESASLPDEAPFLERSPSPELQSQLYHQWQQEGQGEQDDTSRAASCHGHSDRTLKRSGRPHEDESIDDLSCDMSYDMSCEASSFDDATSTGSGYQQQASLNNAHRPSASTAGSHEASGEPSVEIWVQCEYQTSCQDSLTFDEDWSRDPIRARREDALRLDCDEDMRARLEAYILALARESERSE